MKIELTEISKISLSENEILVFSLPDGLDKGEYSQFLAKVDAIIPPGWKGKVLFMCDTVKMTKIEKK